MSHEFKNEGGRSALFQFEVVFYLWFCNRASLHRVFVSDFERSDISTTSGIFIFNQKYGMFHNFIRIGNSDI